MNEQEKAKRYDTLMSEYIRLENMISAVPQLSLDEQMKNVDATVKVLYTPTNEALVNQYKSRMVQIQREAQTNQLIR
jgi:hypothetical protein|tara:strand:+ start:88 stop:318 length:231 start_codon:yes stop_codon:yes gene_type:complete